MRRELIASVAAAVTAATATPAAQAAKPSWPAWWYRQAMCIHRHESVDWHKRTTWNGYPSRDHGGLQIDVGTWAAHGGAGDPADASPYQQLVVAHRIWLADRGSWREWPNSSRECGLR